MARRTLSAPLSYFGGHHYKGTVPRRRILRQV